MSKTLFINLENKSKNTINALINALIERYDELLDDQKKRVSKARHEAIETELKSIEKIVAKLKRAKRRAA